MILAFGKRYVGKLGRLITWRHLTEPQAPLSALIPRRSEAEWVHVLETLYFQY